MTGTQTYRQRWKFTVTEYGELEIQSRYHSGTNFVVAVGDGLGEGVNIEHRNDDVKDRWIPLKSSKQSWNANESSAAYWKTSPTIYYEFIFSDDSSSSEQNMSVLFNAAMENAIDQWRAALDLPLYISNSASSADIVCYGGLENVLEEECDIIINNYEDGKTDLRCSSLSQSCSYAGISVNIFKAVHANVYIATDSNNANTIKNIATHEIGHALGYMGHSIYSNNVMYYKVTGNYMLHDDEKKYLRSIYDYFN